MLPGELHPEPALAIKERFGSGTQIWSLANDEIGYILPAGRFDDKELAYWRDYLTGDYFAGALSLADFAIYCYACIGVRVEERVPGHGLRREELPANIAEWMRRIEALPYFERTVPPHWKE